MTDINPQQPSPESSPPESPMSETSVVSPGMKAAPSSEPSLNDSLREQLLWALGQVWDPELGLDIVTLGLIYDIRIDGNKIEIDMTLTTPGCPVSDTMPQEAEMKAQGALPDYEVHINVVWDPPWSPARLSEDALESLGYRR